MIPGIGANIDFLFFIKMHICDCDIRNRDGELFEGFFPIFVLQKKKSNY